jgi:hypothetical protein
VFTPRQALIQEATSTAAAATSAPTHVTAVTPVTMTKEKPTYKFDPFADDDAESDVSSITSASAADVLTSAFGPYELQTIHIPPAAPRDIARYSSPSPAPSRSPSPPSASLALEREPLSAPPPTPKLSAAPLPPTASEPLLTSDPFSTTQSYAQSASAPATIVNRPRDDYLARIVAGLLLQRQMTGRPRRRAVYASGCGGAGMYRKSRLSAGWEA